MLHDWLKQPSQHNYNRDCRPKNCWTDHLRNYHLKSCHFQIPLVLKILVLKRLHGLMLTNRMTWPSALIRVLIAGGMQGLRHGRRCMLCSQLPEFFWQSAVMDMFLLYVTWSAAASCMFSFSRIFFFIPIHKYSVEWSIPFRLSTGCSRTLGLTSALDMT